MRKILMAKYWTPKQGSHLLLLISLLTAIKNWQHHLTLTADLAILVRNHLQH
jgi:hypothetical protein